MSASVAVHSLARCHPTIALTESTKWLHYLQHLQLQLQLLTVHPADSRPLLAGSATGNECCSYGSDSPAVAQLTIICLLRALARKSARVHISFLSEAAGFVSVRIATEDRSEGLSRTEVLDFVQELRGLTKRAKRRDELHQLNLAFRLRTVTGGNTEILTLAGDRCQLQCKLETSLLAWRPAFSMSIRSTALASADLVRSRPATNYSSHKPRMDTKQRPCEYVQATFTDVLEVVECFGVLERINQNDRRTTYKMIPHTGISAAQHAADRMLANVLLAQKLLRRYKLPGTGLTHHCAATGVKLPPERASDHVDCHMVWMPYDSPTAGDDASAPRIRNRLIVISEESLARRPGGRAPSTVAQLQRNLACQAIAETSVAMQNDYGVLLRPRKEDDQREFKTC